MTLPLYNAAIPDGVNPTLSHSISLDGIPEVGKRYLCPARQGQAVRMEKHQVLTIFNPAGTQVCDFFALVENEPYEFLSMEHCRTSLGRIYVHAGDSLVTNRRRPLIEIIEDSSNGVHDILIACCDQPRYEELGAVGYHDNCADNFRMSLSSIGISPVHVPSPFNIWMNVPVDSDGHYNWTAPVAKAGDSVRLKAHRDCIAVMSACPQDMTPTGS